MHTDEIGTAFGDPLFCGTKTYQFDVPWLTAAPMDPLQPVLIDWEILIATNDYTLAGLNAVTITVGFAGYAPTLTEYAYINLLHPCKVTLLTTT